MGRHLDRSRRLAGLVVVLALQGCENSGLRPRFPQVEQAQEALHGGGERIQAHRTCAAASRSAEGLIGCMRDAGWDFVVRGPGYPEAECWEARDRSEVDRIVPLCFVRSREQPAGAPAAAGR